MPLFTDRLDGAIASLAIKAPCRVATNANITLFGEQTVNSVAVVEGDRVLVKDQTNAVDNGIYEVQESAWRRTKDFDGNRDAVQGTIVLVRPASDGTLFYELTSANPIVFGTSAITFEPADPGVETIVNRLANDADIDDGDAMIAVEREETGAVGRTLHFYIQSSKLPMSQFCDPTSDTQAQVATAFAAAVLAARNGGKVLEFTPGATYTANQTFKFLDVDSTKGLKFWGNGATLENTAAGVVAELMSATATGRNSAVELCDFVFKGNAASTYGIRMRGLGMAGRVEKLRVIDVATAGYLIEWAVCVNFADLYLSGAIDTFTVNPATGMIIERASAGLYTAACTFKNTVLENPIASTGLDLVYSGLNNCFDGGTLESIPRGLRHRSTARETVLKNFDFEGNTDFDALVEGQGLTMEYVNSGSSGVAQPNVMLASTANGTKLRGGYYRRVDIDAAASGSLFEGVDFDDNGSIGITGTGAYQSYGSRFVSTAVAGIKTFTRAVKDRQGPQSLAATLTCTQGATPTTVVSNNEARVNGQMVSLQGLLTFGATGGTAGQPVLVQFPAAYTAKAASVGLPVGTFVYNDAGTRYTGSVILQAAAELAFITNTGTNLFGTNPAITVANGDTLSFSATFPLA
jgi:hypothetical protein